MAPINTFPIQQFIQLVKSAEISQQREIKMDIAAARSLSLSLASLLLKVNEDLETVINELQKSRSQVISIGLDGGELN